MQTGDNALAMWIIGIGVSTDGMETLRQLLPQLGKRAGAAFVIVPAREEVEDKPLVQDLAVYTDMPIVEVVESSSLEPGHIYLRAAAKTLVYQDGRLLAGERDSPQNGPYLPIDDFFTSLGQQVGEQAVGLILAGNGTDGSRGLRIINERGGIIMVQNPASARPDSMPNTAIRFTTPDLVESPDKLAVHLNRIIGTTPGVRQEREEPQSRKGQRQALHGILEQAQQVADIDFTDYRESSLLRRVEKRMLLQQRDSLEAYAALLREQPAELQVLTREMLVGATAFFRDGRAFDFIRNTILPELLALVPQEEMLRIWVAACSTGEEAYSLAILLEEYLRENRLQREFKIFASDIDRSAINLAGEGVYPFSIAADVPPPLLLRYFTREGDTYRVRPPIRDRVLFAVQNILSDPPFTNVHLISCRNFLTYLKAPTQRRVLSSFQFALHSGGFLFLGPNEGLGDQRHAFYQRNRRWNIFQMPESLSTQSLDILTTPGGTQPPPLNRLRLRQPLPPTAGEKAAAEPPPGPAPQPVAANQMVAAGNEALPDSNRMLLAANQGLQSTNAQLQARNEELQALNADLQSRNEQLAQTSNELRHHQEQLREMAQLYTAISTNLSQVIMIIDRQGSIRTSNRGIGHYQVEELVQQPIQNLLPAEQAAHFEQTLNQVLITHLQQRINVSFADTRQQLRWYQLDLIPMLANGMDRVKEIILIAQDITSAESAKDELRELVEQYRSYTEHAQHQILLLDREGIIQTINFTHHTGLTPAQLCGLNFYSFLDPAIIPSIRQEVAQVFAGRPYNILRFTYTNPAGQLIPTTLIATPVYSKGHIAYVALTSETTERLPPAG